MTKRVIVKTPTGTMVGYRETSQQRAARLDREAARAASALRMTKGQRRTLARRARVRTPA